MLYSHIIQLYTDTLSTIMTNEHAYLEKYTSHFILERVAKVLQKGWCWLCVRGELETEQTATCWPHVPLFYSSTSSSFCWAAQPGSWGPNPSVWSWLSLRHLVLNCDWNSNCDCNSNWTLPASNSNSLKPSFVLYLMRKLSFWKNSNDFPSVTVRKQTEKRYRNSKLLTTMSLSSTLATTQRRHPPTHTHRNAHTHTHIYIYIYEISNKFGFSCSFFYFLPLLVFLTLVVFKNLMTDLNTTFGFYSGDCLDRIVVLFNSTTYIGECPVGVKCLWQNLASAGDFVCLCFQKCILCTCVYAWLFVHI